MKKVAIGALALATIIGLTAASPIVTASAEAAAAREAKIWQAIDERNQYIGDLLTEQSNAYLRGDTATAENIENTLTNLGVKHLTNEEIIEFNKQLSTTSVLNDDYDGYYVETDTYTYHQYIVDSGMYSAEFTIIAPKSLESNLVKSGLIAEKHYDSIIAGINVLEILGKSFLGSKFERLDLAFTAIDIFSGLFSDLQPSMTIENVSMQYEWMIAETVCFLSWPRSTGAFDLQCASNYVSFDIVSSAKKLTIENGHAVTEIAPSVLHGEYQSPMYCSTKEYFEYRKTGNKDYDRQEMLQSVDIHDEVGNTVHAVNLLNPDSPTQIR